MKSGVDEMIRQEQAGFRSGRGASEQIFALRSILEQCQECKHQCTLTSLTFQRHLTASSESDFGTLWGSMESLTSLSGLSTFIRLSDLHQSSSYVTEGGSYSSWFEVKSGVQ